jgi:hypothetical protein
MSMPSAMLTFSGNSSFAHSEVAFYILDTIPMLFNVLLFVVVWPPRYLQPKDALPLANQTAQVYPLR